LIDEILQDLAEKDILYSTDGTEMDDEGHADVTMAPPEDVQRNQLEQVPLPSPDEGEQNEIRVAQFGVKSPEKRFGGLRVAYVSWQICIVPT